MHGVVWFIIVGVVGWLTGKIIGGRGYGEKMAGNSTDWLDIILGFAGGSIAGYLLSAARFGEPSLFISYATAGLGSITFVWVARLISSRYLPAKAR